VERLVGNLVDNATRHNVPDGWISVTTRVSAGRPTLRIRNSGPPIAPGDVSRLLEPFQRSAADPRSDRDGLGIGLSIVAAIVDAHHGVLSLWPIPQGGLDVTVTLDVTPDGVNR
jgi:signal transduction histidine kinase